MKKNEKKRKAEEEPEDIKLFVRSVRRKAGKRSVKRKKFNKDFGTNPWIKLQVDRLKKENKERWKTDDATAETDETENAGVAETKKAIEKKDAQTGNKQVAASPVSKYKNECPTRRTSGQKTSQASGVFQKNTTDSSAVFIKYGTGVKTRSGSAVKSKGKNSSLDNTNTTESVTNRFSGAFSIISSEAKDTKRSVKNLKKFGDSADESPGFDAGKQLVTEMLEKSRHAFNQVEKTVALVIGISIGPIAAMVAGAIGPLFLLLLIVITVTDIVITIIVSSLTGILSILASVFMSIFAADYNGASEMYQYAMEYSKDFAEDVAEAYMKDNSLTAAVDGEECAIEDLQIDYEEAYLCYLFTYEQAKYTDELVLDEKSKRSTMNKYYSATDSNKAAFEKVFDEMYVINTDEEGTVTITINSDKDYWGSLDSYYDYQEYNEKYFYKASTGTDNEMQLLARQTTKMMLYGSTWKVKEMMN